MAKKKTRAKKSLPPQPAQLVDVLPAETAKAVALPKISPIDRKFVGHYAINANASAAVRFAGYQVEAAAQKGYELLMNPDIQAHVSAARAKLGEIHFDLANSIIRQLDVMRLADVTDLYDSAGKLRDPSQWPEAVKLLVNGIEIEEEHRGKGDDAYIVRTKKVRLESRKSVIDTLAKILGVLRGPAGGEGDGDFSDPRPKFPTAVVFNITVGEPKR